MRPVSSLVALLMTLAAGAAARAEEPAAPEIVVETDEIDLANVVTSAAKAVATVQETPAIITILTADEIKARGFRTLTQALGTVPGWLEVTAEGNQVSNMLVRGVLQSALLLHDGVSLFDPWANSANFGRTQPIETLKRIEVVTGPGGVLWGANSFLGIVNLITKDAEDVNGLEVSAGYGDGPGNKQDARAYAMFGKTFLDGRLKLFQHVSFESYIGEVFEGRPDNLLSSADEPAGPSFVGAPQRLEPPRSWFLHLDGKFTFGPVSLYYAAPFGDNHPNLTFGNTVQNGSTWNNYDRYGVLEYKDHFFADRFALDAKGYFVQFVRDYSAQVFPPSSVFPPFTDMSGRPNPGGLTFSFLGQNIYRAGGTVDTTIALPGRLRLLVGGEAFYEAAAASTEKLSSPEDSRQLQFVCPVDASGAPLPACQRPAVNAVSRIVGAAYVNAQWHPVASLALDGGLRYQQGFGQRGYAPQLLYTGAVVWSFLGSYHLKANYATGFRPPVFENTDAPAGGLNYGGSPNLKTESSQAFQGEWNARVLRNVERIRELELRVDYSYTVLSDVIQNPQLCLRQHRQARHPLRRRIRQAVPHRRALPAGLVHVPARRDHRRWHRARDAEPLGQRGRLVQPDLAHARREREPPRHHRLRGSEPLPDDDRRHPRRDDDAARERHHVRSSSTGGAASARLPAALLRRAAAGERAVLQRAQPALLLPRPVLRPRAHRRDRPDAGPGLQLLHLGLLPVLVMP